MSKRISFPEAKEWTYFNGKVWRTDRPYYYFKPLTDEDVKELSDNAMSVSGYKMWLQARGVH
jgi:hypothetical protein